MWRVGLEMRRINGCDNSVDKFLSWRMIVLLEKVGVKVSHNITLLSLEMRERMSLNLSRNKAVL